MADVQAGLGGFGVNAAVGGSGVGLNVGGLGLGVGANGAGVGANLGGDSDSSVDSGSGVNIGGDNGVGVNIGGDSGAGVGAGLGADFGGLFHLGGDVDTSGPPCTVQGGPARLVYFPPPGVDASASIESPIDAWGNTFNPDYCYLSVETLYATQAPSGTLSASTVGPTFTNAFFPFRSSEISTLCQSTFSKSAPGSEATSGSSSGGQVDFGGLAAGTDNGPDSCQHIIAPPRFGAICPEWSNGLFWNMNFEAPVQLNQSVANSPPPSGGRPCQGCPPPASPASQAAATTPSPTICSAGWNQIPGGPPGSQVVTPSTAPAGVSPSSFGQYTARQTPGQQSSPAQQTPVQQPPASVAPIGTGSPNYGGSNATATGVGSPTSPPQYTGAAANVPALDAGRGLSSMLIGVLLFSLGFM